MVLGFTLGGVYVNCEHRVFCAVANSFAFCGPKEVYKTPNLASFCLFLDISIIRGATRYDTAENLSKLTFKLVACIKHIFVRPVFRIGFIPSVVLLAEETVITFSVVVIVGSKVFCRGCVFAPLSHKILNMTQPKLSPRDIWRTLILACPRTLSRLCGKFPCQK